MDHKRVTMLTEYIQYHLLPYILWSMIDWILDVVIFLPFPDEDDAESDFVAELLKADEVMCLSV